ncbi:MAG TPA: type II toxin-antitoxin system VapC family toxin [Acidobacteriaceae bacterium]|nr:type II toxin-antitoxin system VapC family toxin [Acidobacteriaceae bacterium]
MIVLDSHVAVWLALQPEKLSHRARAAIRQLEQPPAISTHTLFEVGWLIVRGRIRPQVPLETFLRNMARGFELLPLSTELAVAAAQLPAGFPSDPADRIIAATALVSGAVLITADERIRRSGAVRTLW